MGDQEAISIWSIMHDADLVRLRADRNTRLLIIELKLSDVFQPKVSFSDNDLIIEIGGISSLGATVWQLWPGPVPNLLGLSRAEEATRVEEYQAKGRDVSIAWESIEFSVATERMRVSDASVTFTAKQVVLKIVGHIRSMGFTTLVARGGDSSFRSRDGRRFGIDDLLGLG